jgi:hypothetical protein
MYNSIPSSVVLPLFALIELSFPAKSVLEGLPQKSEQFFNGPEPQPLAAVHFLRRPLELASCGVRFGPESYDKRSSHDVVSPRRRPEKVSRCTDVTSYEADSSHGFRVNKMTDDRITANMASNSLYQFAIARGQALVLPEVFRPGNHPKCFKIEVGMLEVMEDAPVRCAAAAPGAPILLHRRKYAFAFSASTWYSTVTSTDSCSCPGAAF